LRLLVLCPRPGCCQGLVTVGCAHPHLPEMNSNRCGSESCAGTGLSGARSRRQQSRAERLARGLVRPWRSRGRLCRCRASLCRWHCRLCRNRCTTQRWAGRVGRPTRGLAAGPSFRRSASRPRQGRPKRRRSLSGSPGLHRPSPQKDFREAEAAFSCGS
jgi:hypothetical protein